MIIWIDASVDNARDASDSVLEALIELGEAGYRGRHAVIGPRPLLKELSTHEDLSPRARAYFRRVNEEYTQLRPILANPRSIIACSNAVAPIIYGSSWRVPLSVFSDSNYVEVANIVCENDTDYEIYSTFAEVMVRNKFPGCTVSSRSSPGGGGSTATVLTRLLQDPNPIILCILDSDRVVALGAEGSTARGCRNIWQDIWRAQLIVLTSRELENIIPLCLVRRWAQSAGLDESLIINFEMVERALSDYMCLKAGERLCRFYDVSPHAAGHAVTNRALADTARKNALFARCGAGCDSSDCYAGPGLGENFLRRFSVWLKDYGNRRFFPAIDLWARDLIDSVSLFVDLSLALPRKQ